MTRLFVLLFLLALGTINDASGQPAPPQPEFAAHIGVNIRHVGLNSFQYLWIINPKWKNLAIWCNGHRMIRGTDYDVDPLDGALLNHGVWKEKDLIIAIYDLP